MRRSFKSLTEWLEVPVGVVAQIQGHKPSATAEKHHTVGPLDLLRVHYEKIEAWILERPGIVFDAKAALGALRVVAGNFGDCKPVADGVWELRIDWEPGYRVYYAQSGKHLILLLTGGDKRKQQADIDAAVSYWNDWKRKNAK